jgi:hypothetical protein
MTKRDMILPTAMAVILFSLLALWHVNDMRLSENVLLDRVAAIAALVPEWEQAVITSLKEPDDTLTQNGYAILTQYGYT